MKYNHSIPLHEKNKSRTLSMLIYISSVSQNLLTSVLRLETNKYYNTEPCPDVIKLSIQNHPFRKLHILHSVLTGRLSNMRSVENPGVIILI